MRKYRWNARKCAKNMGWLALRLLLAFAICCVLGLSQLPL